MPCQMCNERIQAWEGEPPSCAFDTGRFLPGNWNCATANALRELVEARPLPEGITRDSCDDQHYATVNAYDLCAEGEDEDEDWTPFALWVSWYKRRGKTDALWLLSDTGEPRRPTEADCRAIIARYAEAK